VEFSLLNISLGGLVTSGNDFLKWEVKHDSNLAHLKISLRQNYAVVNYHELSKKDNQYNKKIVILERSEGSPSRINQCFCEILRFTSLLSE